MTAGGIDRDSAEVIANALRKLAEQGDQRHGRPSVPAMRMKAKRGTGYR